MPDICSITGITADAPTPGTGTIRFWRKRFNTDITMRRLNFTLNEETIELLNDLAQRYYKGNKSRTIRAALESLAAHTGHEGWIITGYTALRADGETECHICGKEHLRGELLYKPVFQRGRSPHALPSIPREEWLECKHCVERSDLAQEADTHTG